MTEIYPNLHRELNSERHHSERRHSELRDHSDSEGEQSQEPKTIVKSFKGLDAGPQLDASSKDQSLEPLTRLTLIQDLWSG